jgi:hypothetical protein
VLASGKTTKAAVAAAAAMPTILAELIDRFVTGSEERGSGQRRVHGVEEGADRTRLGGRAIA